MIIPIVCQDLLSFAETFIIQITDQAELVLTVCYASRLCTLRVVSIGATPRALWPNNKITLEIIWQQSLFQYKQSSVITYLRMALLYRMS